jgi:sulfotransferase
MDIISKNQNKSFLTVQEHGRQKQTLLKTLFPQTKIICCVRDIPWILDSFERIANKNALYTNTFIEPEANQCVTTRCDALMDVQKSGQVVKPWFWLQEGYYANSKHDSYS